MMRGRVLIRFLFFSITFLLLYEYKVLFASIPTYESACVPIDVQKEVTECPAGVKQFKVKGQRLQAQVSTTKKEKESLEKKGMVGPGVSDDVVQRARSGFKQTSKERRVEELLKREIALTQRLIRDTPKDDPTRPEVMFRLADLFFEMQENFRYKARSLDEPIFQARKTKNAKRLKELLKEQESYENEVEKWRMAAVKVYAAISKEYPKYNRRDEALFYLAFALEEMARDDRLKRELNGEPVPSEKENSLRAKARVVYHELIKSYPHSKYIPNAYLSFAEYYFQEGQMDAALKFYEKVIEFEDSMVYGYALYKIAWCYINLKKDKEAVEQFIRVISYAESNPSAPDAKALARQSRKELIPPFSRVFSPKKAWEVFQKIGGDMALEMMELLAEYYYNQGQWREAIDSYDTLITIGTPEKACYYKVMILECVKRSEPKERQVSAVKDTVEFMNKFVGSKYSEGVKVECKQKIAQIIADIATAWHQEAVGTPSSPGTDDPKTKQLASELYDVLLSYFPDLDKLQFEGWDEKTRPTKYRIAYYKADLLFNMKRWNECGPAFDQVVEMNPQGEYLEDAAFAAVLCYNNLYMQQHTDDKSRKPKEASKDAKKEKKESEEEKLARLKPRELTDTEKAMLKAYTRYVCYVPESEDLVTIKYRRARIYYEANRWEEAAVLFRDIAYNHNDSELAVYAANLYLDCLNVIGMLNAQRRLECSEEMAQSVERFINDQNLIKDEEFKQQITQLQCGILRKKAEAMTERKQFKESALTYLRIYEEYGDQCPKMDEVLYNAAINFEAAYYIGPAIQVRQNLFKEFPDSPLAKKALFHIAGNYHAIAYFTKAAEYYESFSKQFPGEAEAPEAMRNAIVFRLGLGDYEKALEDAEIFEKNYYQRRPNEAATVYFSVGVIYERLKDWKKLQKHYENYLNRYSKVKAVDELIQANTYIGYALWQQGEIDKAVGYFQKAVALADQGRSKDETLEQRIARYGKMIRGIGEKEEDIKLDVARRMRLMVDAIAKARFYIGERDYIEFQKIKFPTFEPKDTLPGEVRAWFLKKKTQEIGKEKALELINYIPYMEKEERKLFIQNTQFEYWTEKELVPWVKKLEEVRSRAEKQFLEVVEEHVPHWEIAASARIGDMYKASYDFFYNAPVAPIVKQDQELYDIYRAELDKQAQPFKDGAITAYKHCLDVATKVRWFNEFSRACEVELNKMDPRNYPVSDEVRALPTYSMNPLAVPGFISRLKTEEELKAEEIIAKASKRGEETPSGEKQ